MLEHHKDLILGPIDKKELSSRIFIEGHLPNETIKILKDASRHLLNSLPNEVTTAQILQPSLFRKAIEMALPTGETDYDEWLFRELIQIYGVAVNSMQSEMIQEEIPENEYDEIAAAAASSAQGTDIGERIDYLVFEEVGKILATICPDYTEDK